LGHSRKTVLISVLFFSVATIVIPFYILGVDAQSESPDESLWVRFESNEVKGTVTNQDENIYIIRHSGFPTLPGSESFLEATDSIIYGEIINLADKNIYYIEMKGNVYDEGKLLEKTGSKGRDFGADYQYGGESSLYEISNNPLRISLRPGEVTPFVLWPGQTGWDCYEVWIESYKLEDKEKKITPELIRDNLVFEKGELEKSGTYKGRIKNISDDYIDSTAIFVIKYDSNNNIFAVLGDFIGPLSTDTGKSFTISTYLPGFQVKTATDNFLYGSPDHIEVLAVGFTDDEDLLEDNFGFRDFDFESVSQYYPNSKLPQHIDPVQIKNQAEIFPSDTFETGFCQGNAELKIPQAGQPSPKDDSGIMEKETRIPDWVRNNAGWWSSGSIGDQDFASGIQYLIKEKIMQIPQSYISSENLQVHENKASTENGYLKVNGNEFYVPRGGMVDIELTGHFDYEGFPSTIELRMIDPNSFFHDANVFVGKNPDFSYTLTLWDYMAVGKYQLELSRGRDIGTVTFELKSGTPPKTVTEQKIPEWIKSNAEWWSQGLISDDDFVKGIQYLVEQGIIKV